MVTDSGEVTYAELSARVDAVATRLSDLGTAGGVRVGLMFQNSLDYVIWMFGVFQAGGVAVPMDPRLNAVELETLASAVSLRFIAAMDAPSSLSWQSLPGVSKVTGGLWKCKEYWGGHVSDPQDDVLIDQYTSGSGGAPKRIQRTGAQIQEDYRHFSVGLGLQDDTRFLALPPFYHAYGALGMYATLALGGVLLPLPRFTPARVLAAAKQFGPTLLLVTPTMMDMLGKCFLPPNGKDALKSLRHCICSTGHLSRATYDTFHARFDIPVWQQYGSTETLSATFNNGDSFYEGCVGYPFPGVEVAVFDSLGAVQSSFGVGRVGIRSPSVCAGYTGQDHVLVNIEGYVLPGDKGFIDDIGRLHILGRDDVYNVGGYKVDRYEVESVIRTSFPITFVAVLPFERAGQPAVCAVLEADPESVTPERVMVACQRQLLAYKVPARVVVRLKLPRDSNGKVRIADLTTLIASGG